MAERMELGAAGIPQTATFLISSATGVADGLPST